MNVSHIATGEAQMAHFVNAVETGAHTGRAQRLDELMGRWRKQVLKRKGLLSTVSILPLAACGGGSDPMTLTIKNPTDDISARTDLSGFRLDLQNANTELTMTLEQHNAVSFINTAGTQTVVLRTAGTTSTKPGIENYEILEGTTLTILSSTDGVNVTETGTTSAVSTIDVSGRTLTGNFIDFDADDILKVTQSANISGASGDGGGAGTSLGFEALDFANNDGVTLTMTLDQHQSLTTLLNATNSQTFAITTGGAGELGAITARVGIENYLLSAAGNQITVASLETGVNITGGAGADTVVVGNLTVDGTYTDVETISATAGADFSGVNGGAGTGAGTLNVNNSAGTFTMSAAQHQGLATVDFTGGAQTFAITTGGAITARDGIEEYTLSADGNTITVNSDEVGVNVTGGAGADTIVVGGLTTANGTYTGLTAIDTISATAGANIALVNGGAATGAGILDVNNSAAGTFTMTQAQHQGLATVNNTDGVQTFALMTAGVLIAREGIENYTLHNGAGNVISVLAGTNVDARAASADVINVGGLTVTGTYQTGPEDTISATGGANISGATIGSVDALDINNSAGAYTMTLQQHEQLAAVSNTDGIQTFTLTKAGVVTARAGIENYTLHNGAGNVISVLAGTNVDASAASADVINVGGLTVTGTYQLGSEDTISATTGANISGVNGGAATGAGTLNVNNSAGTFTMSAAQHQGLATVSNVTNTQTFVLTSAGEITSRAGIETYTLHNDAGNVISVLAGTNVYASAASADVINVGGLAVTGTYQTGVEDTISATAGANISGAVIGSVDALDINNSAGNYTMTRAQHEQLATVSNTGGIQTFTLTTAGVLTAREGIENYTLHNGSGNVISVLAGTNVNASAASADVINVGGLTVTGTYQTGTEDTISATAGANISGATIGSVDALDINNSAGTYTMTQAQHEQLATVSNTTNAQTFVLTSAGTITARLGIENYHLADAGGSIFTQIADPNTPKTAVSVKSGSGNDLIITSAVDANRDVLTIDLTSGGNDTVRILNDSGSVTPYINVVTFGVLGAGQTLTINGVTYAPTSSASAETVAAFFDNTNFNGAHVSAAASGSAVTFTSIGSEYTAGFIEISGTGADTIVTNVATQGGLVATDFAAFGGGNVGAHNDGNFVATDFRWDGQEGTFAVTIDGFTAKSAFSSSSEKDTIQLEGWSGGYRTIDIGANSLLNFGSGGIIEIDATTYSVSGDQFDNLQTVAQQLASINNLGDGGYYIVIYNGDDLNTADAGLYFARATAGNGLNFQDTNGAAGGFDTDSLELLAVFNGVGANSFSSDNFLIIPTS